jgi:hypothetical protein
MASDYTIIMWVRHRFGVDEHSYPETGVLNEDRNAPFVGLVGEFPFTCPNVDSTQAAVLELEYRGSTQHMAWLEPGGDPDYGGFGISPEYPVQINSHLIAGGVPGAPTKDGLPLWGTRVLLVDPNVLQEENILRIEATVTDYYGRVIEDGFTIDNALIHFKTQTEHSRPNVGPAKG